MRTILMLVSTVAALGSTAAAQQMVTPLSPLGQGFVPNGLQSTPSAPGQNQSFQSDQGQPSDESGLNVYQQNGSTGPKLNWLYSEPAASGRTVPQAPEHPSGPLR
jgi:hypothetical protein